MKKKIFATVLAALCVIGVVFLAIAGIGFAAFFLPMIGGVFKLHSAV